MPRYKAQAPVPVSNVSALLQVYGAPFLQAFAGESCRPGYIKTFVFLTPCPHPPPLLRTQTHGPHRVTHSRRNLHSREQMNVNMCVALFLLFLFNFCFKSFQYCARPFLRACAAAFGHCVLSIDEFIDGLHTTPYESTISCSLTTQRTWTSPDTFLYHTGQII